ncbi:M64 family metallopeptidase [Pendulispora albinea]|uniref:M64 family metallopeptidase n=1 Tax=Pendulispora albinea TaxID=2741071 RepID=A0ABZ2M675_9BACT
MVCLIPTTAWANPFPDPNRVPRDPVSDQPLMSEKLQVANASVAAAGVDIVRAEVEWVSSNDTFRLASAVIEASGTPALLARSQKKDPFGSYQGVLKDNDGKLIGYDSIGTGQEFRRLTRAITLRFPLPTKVSQLTFSAENPSTGVVQPVFTATIDPATLPRVQVDPSTIEVRVLKQATAQPEIAVNLYAEGYLASRKAQFWTDANKAVSTLVNNNFPGVARFTIRAVFSPSNKALGAATDLGSPVQERDSFLGLYYPYWRNFGRWYNVVYPTRESRYRRGIGSVPYDYPIALVDSNRYWGVGNFNELTAIPGSHPSFAYLLLHEFGHYFGLNEEYEGGGPTELEFAPGISEPWSQNITFTTTRANLKWRNFVSASTPIPTPESQWNGSNYGAYLGGYADSTPRNRSHKPGFDCTMESGRSFCPICKDAIGKKVDFDSGKATPLGADDIQ